MKKKKKQTTPSLQRRNHLLLKAERPLTTTAADQALRDGGPFVCHHTVLLAQQHCNTHPASPRVSVTSVLMFWTFCTITISSQKARLLTPMGPLFIPEKKGKLIRVIVSFVSEMYFSFYTTLGPSWILNLSPCSWLLCSFYHMNSYFGLSYCMYIE